MAFYQASQTSGGVYKARERAVGTNEPMNNPEFLAYHAGWQAARQHLSAQQSAHVAQQNIPTAFAPAQTACLQPAAEIQPAAQPSAAAKDWGTYSDTTTAADNVKYHNGKYVTWTPLDRQKLNNLKQELEDEAAARVRRELRRVELTMLDERANAENNVATRQEAPQLSQSPEVCRTNGFTWGDLCTPDTFRHRPRRGCWSPSVSNTDPTATW